MRRLKIIILCAAAHCAEEAGRPAGPLPPGGVDLPGDVSTGEDPDRPRLDLPDHDGGSTSSGSSGGLGTSTGETTGDPDETGSGASSTGDASTTGPGPGEGSTGSSGSSGDAPGVCGDGACDAAEAAVPCYTPGWCYGDCKALPACLSPLPLHTRGGGAQVVLRAPARGLPGHRARRLLRPGRGRQPGGRGLDARIRALGGEVHVR